MKVIVTGSAGFIGFHLTSFLLRNGISVIGIDNFNSYYDPLLKEARHSQLSNISKLHDAQYELMRGDLQDSEFLDSVFSIHKPEKVVNLAAQAGVRYSLTNPSSYIQSNLVGFANLLEQCRTYNIQHLVYASSSSVYGGNEYLPFSEDQNVDHPVSLYAATKKSNELMAHAYSHLYNLPTTGLRFFTVYGPWGRPDMALFKFTDKIFKGEPIEIFNNGKMLRDFTYIDDIIQSMVRVLNKPPMGLDSFDKLNPQPANSWAPYKIFNIGNSNPVNLMDYISTLESIIGLSATKLFLPLQPGDVTSTASDTSKLESWIDFKPSTDVKLGISNFISWYRNYYSI